MSVAPWSHAYGAAGSAQMSLIFFFFETNEPDLIFFFEKNWDWYSFIFHEVYIPRLAKTPLVKEKITTKSLHSQPPGRRHRRRTEPHGA